MNEHVDDAGSLKGDALAEYELSNALLLRGTAAARLGNRTEAARDLEVVAHQIDSVPLLGSLAGLELAEVHLRADDLEGCARELARVAGAPELPSLARARFAGTSAVLAVRSESAATPQRLAELRSAYAAWLSEWRSAPLVEGGLQFLRSARRLALVENVIEAELQAGGGPESALERLLESESAGTLSRRMGASPVTVIQLRRALESLGGGVVLIAPTPYATHVFAVDGAGRRILARGAPGRAVPRGPARRIDAAGGGATVRGRGSQGTRTADRPALLGCGPRADGRLVPRSLHGLRRADLGAACPRADLGGSWLGVEREVTEWPSVAVGLAVESAPRRSGVAGARIAVLDPVVEERGELEALPFDGEELRGLEEIEFQLRRRERATGAAFGAATEGVLYVHAHGEADPRRARPGVLLLADQVVDAGFVERAFEARPAPRFVVLAACHVGRSRLGFGEDGADQLGAAFLLRGTRSCLLSRGELFHVPAKRVAERFLAWLDAGVNPGEATRRARAALQEDGAHPFDVGALRLIGAAR